MQKIYALIIAIIISVSLAGCGAEKLPDTYTVTEENITFSIDRKNNKIMAEDVTYLYTITGTSTEYEIRITYPDGAFYTWNKEANGFCSGGGNYDEELYLDGSILCDTLEQEVAMLDKKSPNYVVIVLLLVMGGVCVFAPRYSWYLSFGWRYKNAEPSDVALNVSRVSGAMIMLFAVAMLFI